MCARYGKHGEHSNHDKCMRRTKTDSILQISPGAPDKARDMASPTPTTDH